MEKKEDNLVEHYRDLHDLKTDFRNFNLFSLVASQVTGTSVVDIGCGSGFFANMLKKRGKNVIGIEPNNGMRELASKINPDVAVLAGGAEDVTSLVTNPVDSVVMLDVLEHVEKDDEQVRKIYTTLKAGGEFIVVVPAHPILYGTRDKEMHHYRRYTKKTLYKVLSDNGFRIVTMRHWNMLGFLPYLIAEKILRKPLQAKFRGGSTVGIGTRALRKGLHLWFRLIENTFDFGFGLSIIAVAKKL